MFVSDFILLRDIDLMHISVLLKSVSTLWLNRTILTLNVEGDPDEVNSRSERSQPYCTTPERHRRSPVDCSTPQVGGCYKYTCKGPPGRFVTNTDVPRCGHFFCQYPENYGDNEYL